jgi:hypothetical protein
MAITTQNLYNQPVPIMKPLLTLVATADVLITPGAFSIFCLDIIFHLQGKRFSDIYDTFCQVKSVNHNIIKVYDDEFPFHSYHDVIQHAHELGRCIFQATLQKSPLVQPKFCSAGCYVPVGCSNVNLMVTSQQFQFCNPAGAVHRVE